MSVERFRMLAAVVSLATIAVAAIGCGGGADEEPAATVEQPAAQTAREPAQPPTAAEEPTVAEERAAAEEPAVVREVAESPYGFYTIQLSSWRTQSQADREARRYQGMGLEAYVQRADVPGMGTWYRVRIGRYPALSEAREAASSMADIENCWVDNFTAGEVPPES